MTRTRWIILAIIILLVSALGYFGVRWWQNRTKEQAAQNAIDAAELANAAMVQGIATNPFEKLLFVGRSSGSINLYIANVTNGETGRLNNNLADAYSNVLSPTQTWYTVSNQIITQHTLTSNTEVGQLSHPTTLADALGAQPSLAIDPSNRYLAWIATDDTGLETIYVYDLEARASTSLYVGEPNLHYSNLTWAPDSNELAFTANLTRLISITRDGGAELNSRVTIPFSQINYLTWLARDEFGCVLTSTDTNPTPFEPVVAVFNRNGTVTEQHAVFEKIGVPKVLWSNDGAEFLFHDPWKNLFFIYDRYDAAKGSITVKAPGKLMPFGWIDGIHIRTSVVPDATTTSNATTASDGTPISARPFIVSAEDWERYNTAVRSILKQFKIDFTSYRFATSDRGLEFSFSINPQQAEPEMIVLQAIAQVYTVLPDIPSVSVRATLPNGTTINLNTVTNESLTGLVENFTEKQFADLFVINKQSPFGKRAIKSDGTGHHYIGDLVYSRFGDYNPLPALAAVQAEMNGYPLIGATDTVTGAAQSSDMQFFLSDEISFLYPSDWSIKTLDSQTTLLYSNETTFASASAWSEFGVTIKRYAAPGVTLEQWLSVNRRDSTLEDINFTLHRPLTGKHIITNNTYSDEYVLQFENVIYVIGVERTGEISSLDRAHLQTIISTLSATYALQRN